MEDQIILNGIPYSAKDVEVIMFGRLVAGVTEISWDTNDEIEKTYVLGSRRPVARTKGKNDSKGEITLLVNEVAGIEIAANGSINQVGEGDITIVFKALPTPLKQVLQGVMFSGKAITVTGGNAQALAYKCPMDILYVSPLKTA